MSVIAFVPARCGSKSIHLKNIKPFCGRPLIYWNLHALQETPEVTKVVLATDCDTIEQTTLGFGLSKVEVYRRDSKNAQDSSSTESVMLEYIEKAKLSDEDFFILVQATSPLTQASDFINALSSLKEKNGDSLLTCVRQKRFYWTEDGEAINYDYNHRPRRQDFDGVLMENGAFYINSVKNIREYQNRLSGKIIVHEMPEYTAVELDEPDDWIVSEMMMRKYILNSKSSTPRIKLFLTDVDGVLTDAGMYYTENGDELKKFNTHDGKGIELLRKAGVKTGIITSEETKMVERRAKKLKVDYLYQGKHGNGKLAVAQEICQKEGIQLREAAYIGDDINCYELLSQVGMAACPANALPQIKQIPNILLLDVKGGDGAVREFAHRILSHNESLL